MIQRIFLDMDGVLADFEGGMAARGVERSGYQYGHLPKHQWTDEQVASDAAVRVEMAKPDFWPSLKVLPGAHSLIWAANTLTAGRVRVLTALPRLDTARDMVERQKREWCRAHIGFYGDEVITCLRAEKRQHAMTDYVLVDDLASNCREWTEAGGTAILHTDATASIDELLRLHYGR